VLDHFNLTIPAAHAGKCVVFLGPSGCGKTTLLKIISGVLTPEQGEVYVLGAQVQGPGSNSATVPQGYTCFPWLTVLGNVEFGLAIQGKSKAERRRVAVEYLNKVRLNEWLPARPAQLSNGMQQRVAIARTLALRRPVVLMDEPFGALDAQTRAEMQQLVLELWAEERNLILFVTHDITEALLLGDRVITFSPRPARILEDLEVPFCRPRLPFLEQEPEFLRLYAALRQLLANPTERKIVMERPAAPARPGF
jgi:NitT/TauT family transport system ATP-binding protein